MLAGALVSRQARAGKGEGVDRKGEQKVKGRGKGDAEGGSKGVEERGRLYFAWGAVKSSLPLVVLGLARIVLTKSANYHVCPPPSPPPFPPSPPPSSPHIFPGTCKRIWGALELLLYAWFGVFVHCVGQRTYEVLCYNRLSNRLWYALPLSLSPSLPLSLSLPSPSLPSPSPPHFFLLFSVPVCSVEPGPEGIHFDPST